MKNKRIIVVNEENNRINEVDLFNLEKSILSKIYIEPYEVKGSLMFRIKADHYESGNLREAETISLEEIEHGLETTRNFRKYKIDTFKYIRLFRTFEIIKSLEVIDDLFITYNLSLALVEEFDYPTKEMVEAKRELIGFYKPKEIGDIGKYYDLFEGTINKDVLIKIMYDKFPKDYFNEREIRPGNALILTIPKNKNKYKKLEDIAYSTIRSINSKKIN